MDKRGPSGFSAHGVYGAGRTWPAGMTARDTTWQEGDVRSGVDSIDKDSSCMAREPA